MLGCRKCANVNDGPEFDALYFVNKDLAYRGGLAAGVRATKYHGSRLRHEISWRFPTDWVASGTNLLRPPSIFRCGGELASDIPVGPTQDPEGCADKHYGLAAGSRDRGRDHSAPLFH